MNKFIVVVVMTMFVFGCGADKSVYINGAEKAMAEKDHAGALKMYKSSVKKNVTSSHYYAGLADIHYAYGYYGEAVNMYTKAMRNASLVRYSLMRGRAYMKLHFYKDAIYDFSNIIDRRGRRMPVAYLERAKALVAKGDYKKANKDLSKAQRFIGDSAELLAGVGDLFFKLNRIDEAKSYIERSIQADATSADAYYLRAKIYYKTKDANQAITDLNRALELDKNNRDAKRMLAWVYATNPLSSYRNGAEALRLAKQLYAIDGDVQYIEVLAAAYAELDDFDNAIKILKEGIRESTDMVQREDFRFDIKNYEKEKKVRLW